MIATIEISMYALTDGYAKSVIDFIQRVKQNKGIRVEVNGLSTQLFGEYDLLMDVLKKEMLQDFELGKTVFILKIAGAELTKDNLPNALK
ncbi:MAG: hypothetical protein V4608_08155 [Bacteroidota bacterium]